MTTETSPELVAQLKRQNELLERQIAVLTSWKIPLRNGLLAGLAGAVGVSLLVGILTTVLKPFEHIAPWLERVTNALEKPRR